MLLYPALYLNDRFSLTIIFITAAYLFAYQIFNKTGLVSTTEKIIQE